MKKGQLLPPLVCPITHAPGRGWGKG